MPIFHTQTPRTRGQTVALQAFIHGQLMLKLLYCWEYGQYGRETMRLSCPSFKSLCAVTALLFLAACSKNVTSDVTRFHQLPAPAGESVAIVAAVKEQQRSLEFSRYAALIGEKLRGLGYSPAGEAAPALIAQLGYGVRSLGPVYDNDSPVSVGVGVAGGSHHSSVGIGISTRLGDRDTKGNYSRFLTFTMTEAATGKTVYEGRVQSNGTTNNLPEVMPYLIDALFLDFPGKSGSSNTVRAKLNE